MIQQLSKKRKKKKLDCLQENICDLLNISGGHFGSSIFRLFDSDVLVSPKQVATFVQATTYSIHSMQLCAFIDLKYASIKGTHNLSTFCFFPLCFGGRF